MTLYLLFCVAMLLQVTVGRTQLLAMRGGMNATNGFIGSLIGIAAGLSFFAVLIWGFASFHWYVALPTILAAGIFSGLIVDLRSFAFWYRIQGMIDFAAVAVTIWLWMKYWPF